MRKEKFQLYFMMNQTQTVKRLYVTMTALVICKNYKYLIDYF